MTQILQRLPGRAVRSIRTAMIWSSLFFAVLAQAAESVKVYPAPAGEPLSTLFSVTVADQPSPVYVAAVGSLTGPKLQEELTGRASFTSFDMANPIAVSVTYAKPIQQVKILPARLGITPSISGNKVIFTISKPGQLTLEVNGDWNNSLHLFANPFETDVPDPHDPKVIYFGPGIHQVQNIEVTSGKTVYIAGGAVVYARWTPGQHKNSVFKFSGSNITVRGRGIIDGSTMPKEYNGEKVGTHLLLGQGSGLQVEGITLRDSSSWSLRINESDNVLITNVKVFGWRENSDGTDIDNSRNVVVSDSFYRTYDDLVVVKTSRVGGGESSNITVKGCVLWNEKAHALTLGTELKEKVNGVLFTDCDIIHDKGHDALLATLDDHQGGVKNVTFKDLRVEESMRLIFLAVRETPKGRDDDRGYIDTVTFQNITAPVPSRAGPNIELAGFGPGNALNSVIFDNVTIGGVRLQSGDVHANSFVGQITITP